MPLSPWYPSAGRKWTTVGCGPFIPGFSARVVLHKTETPVGSLDGVVNGYARTKAFPHFTIDGDRIEQHVPLGQGATALVHNSGTIDTNRAGAIQIEIVGFSAHPEEPLPSGLAGLFRWIEAEWGVVWVHPPFGAQVGRMTDALWRVFNGYCGHEHVPHQEPTNHWDPGALRIDALAPTSTSSATPTPGPTFGPIAIFGDDMQRIPVTSPPLDENGDGWIETGVVFEKLNNILPLGPSPDRDGYAWPNWYWSVNNTGGKARIEIEGAAPHGTVSFVLWAVA